MGNHYERAKVRYSILVEVSCWPGCGVSRRTGWPGRTEVDSHIPHEDRRPVPGCASAREINRQVLDCIGDSSIPAATSLETTCCSKDWPSIGLSRRAVQCGRRRCTIDAKPTL